MSLIHWWPLNGNTKDYGLNNAILVNNNATVNNSGKIGKCYSFSDYRWLADSNAETVNYPISISAWIYPTNVASTTTQYIVSYNTGTGGTAGHTIGFGMYGSSSLHVWGGGNVYSTGYTLSNNTWYHITVTIDENKQMITYVNGVKKHSITVSNHTGATWFTIGGRSNSSTGGANGAAYFFSGSINDVRIYDHALSAKEVKEISKGLVLHYNFEDEEIEPTTNLLNASYSPITPSPYNSNFQTLTETYHNNPIIRCTGTSSSNSGFRYSVSTNLAVGQSVTFSLYLRYNGSKTNFSSYHGGSADGSYRDPIAQRSISAGGTGQSTWVRETVTIYDEFRQKVLIWNDVVVGKWYFIETVLTNIFSSQITTVNHYFLGGSNAGTWDIACPQLEKKDHATPYINGTRDAGKVYDNSGYGYNGYQQGENIQIVPDSASGKHSARFDSSGSGTSWLNTNGIEPLHNFTNLTYTAWVYQRTRTDDRACICIGQAYFTIDVNGHLSGYAYGKNPAGYHTGSGVIPLNTWTHIAIVWDDSYIYGYINGVQDFKIATTGIISYLGISIGKEGGSWRQLKGSIADLKIYSTALSADDIMLEYRRKAAIARNGRLITGLFIEDNSADAVKIDKNDFIKATHIVEYDINEDYQPVEYIQSDGNQWINTNYTNTSEKIKVEFKCYFPYTTNGLSLFGANSSSGYNLVPYSYGNRVFTHWVGGSANFMSITYGESINEVIYNLNNGNISCTLNGITTNSTYSSTIVRGVVIYIFGKNRNGTSSERGNGYRLYYWRLYDNDKLVRNFIPCYRKSDNVIGLYDTVNKVFYTNQGTGTFTKGPDINALNIVKFGHKYTALEYIESSGTQYIDTGVSIGDDFEFILDQLNNFDTGNHYMVGSYTGGQMMGTLRNVLWTNVVVMATSVTIDTNVRQLLGAKIKLYGSGGSDWEMTNYTKKLSASGHGSYTTSVSSNKVFLFKVNGTNGESFRCYRFQLLTNNKLVIDMVPAKRNSDNAIGMFDLIERKFYTNVGSGTFTAGPEIATLSVVNAIEIIED